MRIYKPHGMRRKCLTPLEKGAKRRHMVAEGASMRGENATKKGQVPKITPDERGLR